MIGHKKWAIAEGYIPGGSNGPPEMQSHETLCFLNAGDEDAHVSIVIYYEDKDPVGPYKVTVEARRTRHVRLDKLKDPEPIPKDTPYACTITADFPVVCQHTRLDSRQAENALLSTMAFPVT